MIRQSAFQANAFQNDAFQVYGEQAGSAGKGGKKPYSEPAKQLYEQYKDALDDVEGRNRRIISAIDPFIEPQNEVEQQRRSKAQYIADDLPAVERIDFEAIAKNLIAQQRLIDALRDAKARKLRQQEDEAALATALLFLWP